MTPPGPDERADPVDDPGAAFEQYDDEQTGDGDLDVPMDEPLGVDRFGTTAEEQREGASLDRRLAAEQPDAALPRDPDVPAEEAAMRIDPA